MPMVAIRNLMDGMVLADAATSAEGEIAPAGAQVDRALVARLAGAGVGGVRVTDESYGLAALIAEAGGTPRPRPESGRANAGASAAAQSAGADATPVQAALMRIARMFNPHRDDRLMRELCRLAIKCARERLIRV